MIDFQNGSVFKLSSTDLASIRPDIQPLLIEGENLFQAYKGARDYVALTDRRLIAVNVQGMTGKKRDFTSLPWSKLQAWSIETAGSFDRDSELEMWFSGLGKVRLEFRGDVDIRSIGQLIGHHVL